MFTSNTFQNLTEEEVQELYDELKSEGFTEDDIFEMIYQIDCNKD